MFGRDTVMENEIINKMNEWKSEGNEIFDFRLPNNIKIVLNPRKDGDDGVCTGRCRPSASVIWLCYCNDITENLHVLLHEMCHLNRAAYYHDKIYCNSLAYAATKITGNKFDPSKPMRKLDTDVAVAFGATARKECADNNNKYKQEDEIRMKNAARTFFRPGDTVEYMEKISNGYSSWDCAAVGIIIDINVETARCHIKNINTGEVVSRKVNKIFKINKVIVERS